MEKKSPKLLVREAATCPGSEVECPIPCALCAWPRPVGKTVLELCRTGVNWEAHVLQMEKISLPILEGTGINLKDCLVEPNNEAR